MIKSWTECWFQRNDDLILLFLIESAVYFVRQSCRDADISILPGTFGASAPCSETMVGSTLCLDLRAFRCLRCLKLVMTLWLPILLSFGISQFYWRCHTWVNCGNIEEAENERMHLLICMKMFKAAGDVSFEINSPSLWHILPRKCNVVTNACLAWKTRQIWQMLGFINLKSLLSWIANRKYSKFDHSVHGNNALRDGNDGFQQPGWFHDTLLGGGPSHTMEWGRRWMPWIPLRSWGRRSSWHRFWRPSMWSIQAICLWYTGKF